MARSTGVFQQMELREKFRRLEEQLKKGKGGETRPEATPPTEETPPPASGEKPEPAEKTDEHH